MPKISIIVPVYNAEKYLERCIESLAHQTIKDIEVILVDDGSKDSSLDICNRFAKKDKRIKVISQKNAGPSVARNNALKLATGEFIGFVDSDDYVKEDTYEKALAKMKNDVDLVIWAVNVVSDDDLSYTEWFQDRYFKLKFQGKVELTNDVKFKTDVVPWNKLYRASIISDNNITFPAGRLYEDNAFWWKYTSFCKNAYYLDEKLHYYNMRLCSLRGEVIAKKQECEKDRIYMVENVFDYFVEHDLLNKKNNEAIEKLFLISYVDAYDETSQKVAITFAGRDLIEKIVSQRIKNKKSKVKNICSHFDVIKDEDTRKLAENIFEKCKYLEKVVVDFDQKHTLNIAQDHDFSEDEKIEIAKNIKERVDFAKNNINKSKETVFVNDNVKTAAKDLTMLIENEMQKLGLQDSYKFLKNFTRNIPEVEELKYDGIFINDYILPFLETLLKLKRCDELTKLCHFFNVVYPECEEFNRMLGDVYLFLKKDEDTAMFYYLKYTDAIKDNPSVYHVLAELCERRGDIYHQIFFKQKEIKALQGLA